MEKDDLMILLERIETKVGFVAEGVDANRNRHEQASIERRELKEAHEQTHLRLRMIETKYEGVETRLEGVETRLEGVDTRMDDMQ